MRFLAANSGRNHPWRKGIRSGFTLVEILIVVVILGILAAIVVPQFSNATNLTRENTLKDDLRYLRMQITVFKAQHRDVSPGFTGGNPSGSASTADFLAQMTKYTDAYCNVSSTPSATYALGPYLEKMPPNPINGLDTMLIVSGAMPSPTGTYGWVYNPATQEVMADLTGTDSDGKAYSQY